MAGLLDGRRALITGANRGIGRSIAFAYARAGASCVLAGRQASELEALARELSAIGPSASTIELMLDDPASIAAAGRRVTEQLKTLDILVLNAASLGARQPIIQYPADIWRHTFEVNVHANLLMLQAFDPLLRASPSGRVIFLSAGVATMAKAGTGSYAVSKAALEGLARVYMIEGKDTPIRVNTVNPGPTRTEMRARAAPDEDPMTIKTPEDIAPLFVELASADCTRQGEVISADVWLKQR